MKTILLGPNGQLGTDIRAVNHHRGEPLSVDPIDRSMVDLTDVDAIGRCLRDREFGCLINCASYHKTDEVEQNSERAFAINAHSVRRLAEICADKRARFVHVSTDYVFGGQQKRAPLIESDEKAPVNVYGESKGLGEDLALGAGAEVLVLRVASLFGVAGSSGKGGNFVETVIRLGRERGELRVVADQTMSPTSTRDIAEALIRMLEHDVPPGIWHVVNSGAATWHEFATRIVERANVAAVVVPVETSAFPTPARRPPYSVLDNSKLAAAVGSMRDWQDALDDYLVARGHRLN